MKDKSKKGFFKQLFGQGSYCCCSFDIEEIKSDEQKSHDGGNNASNSFCCPSQSKPVVEKNKDLEK